MKESNRRAFLRDTFLTALSVVVTSSCQKPPQRKDRTKQEPQSVAPPQQSAIRPAFALSLTVLQEQARRQRTLSDELTRLSGLNRIQGFMTEPDGEVILLGNRDEALPSLHLDDVAVALRNAYQINSAYQGVLGCTIDPWEGTEDPWRIQQAKVFGMPANVRMAARHVAIDFELKKISAGIASLGNDTPSLYELQRTASPLCEGEEEKEKQTEMTHRFWFYPLYSPRPRFTQNDCIVWILKPVGVQLLTERQFRDRAGTRTGAAPAAPLAEQFAQSITRLLAGDQVRQYMEIRNDFRVIEVAQLLRFKRVSQQSLVYFLQDHPLTEATTPAFVGGIRREEKGEVVCASKITEEQTPKGKLIKSKEQTHQYHTISRGGVEAKVEVDHPEDFGKEPSGVLADLCRRVRASRPAARGLLWPIKD